MTTADATHEGGRPGGHYSTVSIVLHWLIAALLIGQVLIGGAFEDARGPNRGQLFALHLSLGVTILTLSLVRLGWRVTHPAPPLPSNYSRPVRLLARATHVLFYVVLIGMPLTGWITSSGWPGSFPDIWGVLPWPKLPVGEALADAAGALHTEVILKMFWVLLALHIAGALKHQLLDRDGTLWRMLPIVPRPKTS